MWQYTPGSVFKRSGGNYEAADGEGGKCDTSPIMIHPKNGGSHIHIWIVILALDALLMSM